MKVLNKFKMDDLLYSVACGDSGDVWAVGNGSPVLYQDGFWNKTNAPRNTNNRETSYSKVKIINNEVWLVGGSSLKEDLQNGKLEIQGVLLKSSDNGQTWEDKAPAETDDLTDIYFEGKSGWLVGKKGLIYYTNDGGDSWAKQKSSTENDLYSIFFLDSNNGWISGDKTTVLKYKE